MSTTPVATTWDAIVAALNGLGTWQLVAVMVAIVAAVWTLGRVFTLVEVLVRGHAPADAPELDELAEVLGRIEDALGEHGHLAGCLGDIYGELDEQTSHARVHGDNVEQLLADNLAATRTVTLAVQALDDELDEGELDTRAQAQLYAYVPGSYVTEPKTDADRSTRLHELAIELAGADADARGIDLGPTDDDYRLAGSDDGIRSTGDRLDADELDRLRAELTGAVNRVAPVPPLTCQLCGAEFPADLDEPHECDDEPAVDLTKGPGGEQ